MTEATVLLDERSLKNFYTLRQTTKINKKAPYLSASWAEDRQEGFQAKRAYKRDTALAEDLGPSTEVRCVGLKFGNLKFMAVARPCPSCQSLLTGVPRMEAIL